MVSAVDREPFPTFDEAERAHVAAALSRSGGNRSAAARLLGISRNALYRLLQRHGLEEGAAGSEATRPA